MSSSVISLDFKVFPVDVIHPWSRLIPRYFVEIISEIHKSPEEKRTRFYLFGEKTHNKNREPQSSVGPGSCEQNSNHHSRESERAFCLRL